MKGYWIADEEREADRKARREIEGGGGRETSGLKERQGKRKR